MAEATFEDFFDWLMERRPAAREKPGAPLRSRGKEKTPALRGGGGGGGGGGSYEPVTSFTIAFGFGTTNDALSLPRSSDWSELNSRERSSSTATSWRRTT